MTTSESCQRNEPLIFCGCFLISGLGFTSYEIASDLFVTASLSYVWVKNRRARQELNSFSARPTCRDTRN
jgi:hypothetical protein